MAKQGPKGSPELSEAAQRDIARAEALDALYRPIREAGEADLQKTKSGRKLLEATRAFGAELSEAYEGIRSGKKSSIKSAFVGQDFPVPAGPANYTTTITYDWICTGGGGAFLGVSIVNVDLAIVIDKRDGNRDIYAREISLLTVPFAGGDGFTHFATGVKVTIPFTRDGSNGTVRIMVGADGNCTTVAAAGGAYFRADATVREICISSTA